MMKLLAFAKKFGTEQQCKEHFILYRKEKGVVCKKCKGTRHYWLPKKEQFQCSACSFRTCLRSGTVLEHSKMPYLYWYTAIYLMTYSKKGLSAKELQRQLEHSRYEPIWLMMQKIRNQMGKRENRYKLERMVEADSAFFETTAVADSQHKSKRVKKIQSYRGKGSGRVWPVLVMAESLPGEPDESRNSSSRNPLGNRIRYVRIKQLEGHKAIHVTEVMKQTLASGHTEVVTDMGTEMVAITEVANQHYKVHSTPLNNDRHLHWVNIVTANAKNAIKGVYHRVSAKYLQNYLDEFTYKFNRRYFGPQIFERLLNIAIVNC